MKRLALLSLCCCSAALAATNEDLLRCRQLPDAGARLACYDALPTAPTAPGSAVAPATSFGNDAETFGLSRRPKGQAELAHIESRIAGHFDGWQPGSLIRLANGQRWQINDDSYGAYDLQDPKVLVERGSMGGFFLHVEGVQATPRVRRLP